MSLITANLNRKAKVYVHYVLLYAALTLMAILMAGPFVWSLSTSLKTAAGAIDFPPSLFPEHPQWVNYLTVMQTAEFPRYFFNSAVVTTSHVIATLLMASLAAYAFARLDFPLRNVLFVLFLCGMMIPPQVTVVPKFLMMRVFGWIDTYWGLILPGLFTPFALFVFRQFFLGIPKELEQAAIIDGCSLKQVFVKIVLPLSKPAIATMAIFRFVFSWNELLWPLVITNSAKMRVVQVGLTIFQVEGEMQRHLLMAAAVMAVVPTLLIFFALQRHFISMQASTGLKL